MSTWCLGSAQERSKREINRAGGIEVPKGRKGARDIKKQGGGAFLARLMLRKHQGPG